MYENSSSCACTCGWTIRPGSIGCSTIEKRPSLESPEILKIAPNPPNETALPSCGGITSVVIGITSQLCQVHQLGIFSLTVPVSTHAITCPRLCPRFQRWLPRAEAGRPVAYSQL